jgi:hypothetical protein
MLATLADHGFVRPYVKGAFHVKTRFATRWILTRYEFRGQKASMDFMRWKPGAEFKQRYFPEDQTVLPRAPDGGGKPESGAPRRPDSTVSAAATVPLGSTVLVYQGERSSSVRPPQDPAAPGQHGCATISRLACSALPMSRPPWQSELMMWARSRPAKSRSRTPAGRSSPRWSRGKCTGGTDRITAAGPRRRNARHGPRPPARSRPHFGIHP